MEELIRRRIPNHKVGGLLKLLKSLIRKQKIAKEISKEIDEGIKEVSGKAVYDSKLGDLLKWWQKDARDVYRQSKNKKIENALKRLQVKSVLKEDGLINNDRLLHQRKSSLPQSILTPKSAKNSKTYGPKEIVNKVWWQEGIPFYETAENTISIPKSRVIYEEVPGHFNSMVKVSGETNIEGNDVIRSLADYITGYQIPQSHSIFI